MKYTLIASENETRLAAIDHFAGHDGHLWEVSLPGSNGTDEKQNWNGATVQILDGLCEISFNGERQTFPIRQRNADGSIDIATALGSLRLLVSRGASLDASGRAGSGQKAIKSSMPGKVIKLLCKTGDAIEAGQPLMIIEAMKMENEIRSPQAGVIEEISVEPGKKVESGELLIKLGPVKV